MEALREKEERTTTTEQSGAEAFYDTIDKIDVILEVVNATKPRWRSAWRAHLVNGCKRGCWYCAMEKKLRGLPITQAV